MRDIGLEVDYKVDGNNKPYAPTQFMFKCETEHEMDERYDDLRRSIMESGHKLFAYTEVILGETIDTSKRRIYRAKDVTSVKTEDGFYVVMHADDRNGTQEV